MYARGREGDKCTPGEEKGINVRPGKRRQYLVAQFSFRLSLITTSRPFMASSDLSLMERSDAAKSGRAQAPNLFC